MMNKTTVVLVLWATSLFASELPLRSARVEIPLVILGDGPVALQARNFSFEGFSELALVQLADCYYGCQPGTPVGVGMHVTGGDIPGVVDMGDQTFTDVGGMASRESMALTISGQGIVPRSTTATSRTKFYRAMLEARFTHYDGVPIAPVEEVVRGRVTAIVQWERSDSGWYVEGVTYLK